ncbi:MAG TPA: aminoglycoside phosphotransferase [Candidatus Angelobacter sp.]|jgi:maltokinase|nr:aminoglycoside phosphotransferase [Candidatus Angelobacter sp.]
MSLDVLAAHGLPDTAVLGEYLQRQRWYAGRSRVLRDVRVLDAAVLQEGNPALVFVLLGASYGDGGEERYQVPLAVREGDPPADLGERLVAQGEQDGRMLSVYDGLAEPSLAWWFWQAMAETSALRTDAGELLFRSEGVTLDGPGPDTVRSLGREQSNTSLVRGDAEVLKIMRRIESGPTPELEMTLALSRAGFTHIARPLGSGEYVSGDAEPALAAMLQEYLHNGTEGWSLALTSLRDLYANAEEAPPQDDAARRLAVQEQGSSFQPEAGRLGEVTAEMHLALASPDLPEAMRAEPLTAPMLDTWAGEMTAELDRLLGNDSPMLAPLRARRPAIVARFEALRSLSDAGLAIRIHGDYHLGQVLRVDAGWVILDFEGEPDRPLAARRVRSSPLRDVAAMLRSFHYAAAAALMERCAPDSTDWEPLFLQGVQWADASGEAFWNAYLERASQGDLLPPPAAVNALCDAFTLQKAVYEVGYELGHRPDWVSIPLRQLLSENP